jgi:hypothetical protein
VANASVTKVTNMWVVVEEIISLQFPRLPIIRPLNPPRVGWTGAPIAAQDLSTFPDIFHIVSYAPVTARLSESLIITNDVIVTDPN